MKTKIITICSFIFLIPFIVSAQFEKLPDMELGYTGAHVTELQKFLNANNYIVNPTAGEPGSIGNEGTYFGILTQKALSLFQKDNSILPSNGYFGAKTKAEINEVVQQVKEGDLSFTPTQVAEITYNVNYIVKGIPYNSAGCNNKLYNPTIVNASNIIGPFTYPVQMTFVGAVDDNLMINGVIVDKNMNILSGGCSGKHNLTYSQNFAANTPIKFNVIDNYGVETSLVGTVTIKSQTPPPTFNKVKLSATAIGGTIIQPSSTGTYDKLQLIKIEAKPQTGYVFEKWSGACSGTSTSCSIMMDANKSVSASFKKTTQVTFAIKGSGKIQANITMAGETEKTVIYDKTTTIEVPYYADIKLNAIANDDARVVGWTDAICKRLANTDSNVKELLCNKYPTSVDASLGYSNVTFSAEFAEVKEVGKCAQSSIADHHYFKNIGDLEKKIVQLAQNKPDSNLKINANAEVFVLTVQYKDGGICARFIDMPLGGGELSDYDVSSFFKAYIGKGVTSMFSYHSHDFNSLRYLSKNEILKRSFIYKNKNYYSSIPSDADLAGSYLAKINNYHSILGLNDVIERAVSADGVVYQYDQPKNSKFKNIFTNATKIKKFTDDLFKLIETVTDKSRIADNRQTYNNKDAQKAQDALLKFYRQQLDSKFSTYNVQ